ncbi:hypothetical protein ACFUC1_03605 [Pedococcus sp. NPDC057267]|uniref:hypothetical protein n=1 Tax=Pedococcus sp. NPDC057267 TaxID=3346077 RepID=UPI00362ABC1F
MADQERAPVGSVAEEAARLLDALGGWAASSGYAAGASSRGSAEDEGHPPHVDTHGSPGPAAEDGGHPTTGATPDDGAHCEHCGAETGAGRAVVCRLCPVCQGIGLLRSVRPETVDRLADLAGAIADTLRDLADHRRAGAESAGAAAPSGTTPGDAGARHTRSRVQDIAVEDETTATP